jgi:hypothetical protein
MYRFAWTMSLLTLSAFAPRAVAQQSDDISMMQVAFGSVRDRLPEGVIALDTSESSDARTVELARDLTLQVGSISQLRSCASRVPSSCRLVGVSGVVRLGEPQMMGDSAKVDVQLWYTTTSRHTPVASEILKVHLVKAGDTWRAGEVELIAIT